MAGIGNNPADCTPAVRRKQRMDNKDVYLGVRNCIEFIQINLQHNKAASAPLCKQIAEMQYTVIFVQEPWINKNRILD